MQLKHYLPSMDIVLYSAKLLLVTLIGIMLLISLFMYIHMENYFVPYPAIDTRFAPEYNEEKFNQIQVGMTESEVVTQIGNPLTIMNYENNPTTFWFYTVDGAAFFGDFAWLERTVVFDDQGYVVNLQTGVIRD